MGSGEVVQDKAWQGTVIDAQGSTATLTGWLGRAPTLEEGEGVRWFPNRLSAQGLLPGALPQSEVSILRLSSPESQAAEAREPQHQGLLVPQGKER